MRRPKKEIKEMDVVVGLLTTCQVGRLGTMGGDGYPMIKPLNFVYSGNAIYFHSALEGEKMEDIRRDGHVCFEIDLSLAYAKSAEGPCGTDYLYRSVIIRGRASPVETAAEKREALKLLMMKYEPGSTVGEFPEDKIAITGVVRIDIETMTGKEDLGSGKVRDTVHRAIEEGSPLPIFVQK
jgi:nitroimidazol reductase NimA-like FMN-containing flavoprotein (pyridoxamine 5'-phosphate oxidase superfamily)